MPNDYNVVIQSLKDPSIILTDEQKAIKAELLNSFDFTSTDIAFSRTVTLENGVSGQVNIHMDGSTSVFTNSYGPIDPKMNAADRARARSEISAQFRESAEVQKATEAMRKDYTEFKNDILSQAQEVPVQNAPVVEPVTKPPVPDAPVMEAPSSELVTSTQLDSLNQVAANPLEVRSPHNIQIGDLSKGDTLWSQQIKSTNGVTGTISIDKSGNISYEFQHYPEKDISSVNELLESRMRLEQGFIQDPYVMDARNLLEANYADLNNIYNLYPSNNVSLPEYLSTGQGNVFFENYNNLISNPSFEALHPQFEGITYNLPKNPTAEFFQGVKDFMTSPAGMTIIASAAVLGALLLWRYALKKRNEKVTFHAPERERFYYAPVRDAEPSKEKEVKEEGKEEQKEEEVKEEQENGEEKAFEKEQESVTLEQNSAPAKEKGKKAEQEPPVREEKVKEDSSSPASEEVRDAEENDKSMKGAEEQMSKEDFVPEAAPVEEVEKSEFALSEDEGKEEAKESELDKEKEGGKEPITLESEESFKNTQNTPEPREGQQELEEEDEHLMKGDEETLADFLNTPKQEELVKEEEKNKNHSGKKEKISDPNQIPLRYATEEDLNPPEVDDLFTPIKNPAVEVVQNREDFKEFENENFELDEKNGVIIFHGLVQRTDVNRALNAAIESGKTFNSIVIDQDVEKVTSDAFLQYKELTENSAVRCKSLTVKDGSKLKIYTGGLTNSKGRETHFLYGLRSDMETLIMEKGIPLTTDNHMLAGLAEGNTAALVLVDVPKVPSHFASRSKLGTVISINSSENFITDIGKGAFKTSKVIYDEDDSLPLESHLLHDKDYPNINKATKEILERAKNNFEYSRDLDISRLNNTLSTKEQNRVKERVLKEMIAEGGYKEFADAFIEINKGEKQYTAIRDSLYMKDKAEGKIFTGDAKETYYFEQELKNKRDYHNKKASEIFKEFENSKVFQERLKEALQKDSKARKEIEANENALKEIKRIQAHKAKGERIDESLTIKHNDMGRLHVDIENLDQSSISKDAFMNTRVSFGDTKEYRDALQHAYDKRERLENFLKDEPVAFTEEEIKAIRELRDKIINPEKNRYVSEAEIKGHLESLTPLKIKERMKEVPNGEHVLEDYVTNEMTISSLESHTAFVTGKNTIVGRRAFMNSGITGIAQSENIRKVEMNRATYEENIAELEAQKAVLEKDNDEDKNKEEIEKLEKKIKAEEEKIENIGKNKDGSGIDLTSEFDKAAFAYNDIKISEAYTTKDKEAYIGNKQGNVLKKLNGDRPFENTYTYRPLKEHKDKEKFSLAKLFTAFTEQYKKMTIPKAFLNICALPIVTAVYISTLRLNHGAMKETEQQRREREAELDSAMKGEGINLEYTPEKGRISARPATKEDIKNISAINKRLLERIGARYNAKDAKITTIIMDLDQVLKSNINWISAHPFAIPTISEKTAKSGKKKTYTHYALQIPADTWLKDENVKDKNGNGLEANERGVDHGEGDWILIKKNKDGTPDFNSIQIVNGKEADEYFEHGSLCSDKIINKLKTHDYSKKKENAKTSIGLER